MKKIFALLCILFLSAGMCFADDYVEEDEWIEYARENADSRGYGEIKPGNIRFYVRSFEDKTNIIFADFSFEMEQRRNFVFLCLMGFMMACLAIFILSWFLSGWVVKPVKEAWDMQNQFIADASHELKTPLTVIIADSNILMSHGDSKISEQKRWIDSIRDESLAMKKLVEDMLFISKANVEKSYKEIAEFDVSDVVTDKTLEFEAVAYEKQVELHDDIERGLRTTGDRTEFGRLTAVLLDNAIKYAESNGSNKKTVRISLKKSGKKIKLSVSNSCNGLNENTIRHAFDRFYRGDVTRNRDDGSYGLGLSIAAEIVKQMAGKIECRYERGCAVFEAEINSSNKN